MDTVSSMNLAALSAITSNPEVVSLSTGNEAAEAAFGATVLHRALSYR
jgi:hypothetical protein